METPSRISIPYLLNWATNNDEDWMKTAHLLIAHWPFDVESQLETEDDDFSGIDCQVLVLRYILYILNRETSHSLFKRHHTRNILVDFAGCDFRTGGRWFPDMEKIQSSRRVVFSTLLEHLKVPRDGLSFMNIDEHEYMRQTILQDFGLQAFHKSRVRLPNQTNFQPRHDLEVDPSDLDEIRTSRSLFHWDTTVHHDLSEVLRENPRERLHKGQYGTYSLFRKLPLITRVLFDPRANELPGFSIHSVYKTTIQHMEEKFVRGEDQAGAKNELVYSRATPVTLSLIAVVRLRNTDSERDYVRIYQVNGCLMMPSALPGTYRSYQNDEWSISEQDHRYMLYFAAVMEPSGQPPSLHELASENPTREASPPPEQKDRVDKLFTDFDSEYGVAQSAIDLGRLRPNTAMFSTTVNRFESSRTAPTDRESN